MKLIASEKGDIPDIDWELWVLRQDQPPFFNSFWLKVEGPHMREIIGGGFTKQLCLRENNNSWWIRSASDFERLRKDIRQFVIGSPESALENIFTEAKHQQKIAQSLIDRIRSYESEQILKEFLELLRALDLILLYTTSVPYFLLDTLEKTGTDGIESADYVKTECNALRATSSYRQLKTEIMDRMTTAIQVDLRLPMRKPLRSRERRC